MSRAAEQIFFSGRVQGVGFRYTVRQLAKGYEVTGFVRNLIDGRVEMVMLGTERERQEFLGAITSEMEGYIQQIERNPLDEAEQFHDFSIR